MRIKAITFDVGGTLIEPWPSVGHVYAGVAARFGVSGISPDALTRNFIRAWKARAHFDYARESWFGLVREAFAGRSPDLPPEFFHAVYDRFADADCWRVFDDVIPTLQNLTRRGVALGVISNWDERLRPLLQGLNLSPLFSSIVVSCEAGATKPDRRLFEQAAWELDVNLHELLHVGDSHEMDVIGAVNAGAQGRQVIRGGPLTAAGQMGSLLPLCDDGVTARAGD